jgi:DNA-binding LacI/PurR family transcriptional regulator
MSVTIKDIALKTGVSMATVSRVINNFGYVSAEKRKLVEEAVAEYNYVPSAMAKGLSRQSNNMVGALIPEIDNPFFSGVIHGITEICDKENLNLILCSTGAGAAFCPCPAGAAHLRPDCGIFCERSLSEQGVRQNIPEHGLPSGSGRP